MEYTIYFKKELNMKDNTKLLSMDTETLGIHKATKLIEFSCVPACPITREIREDLAFHALIKCDSYEALEPTLSDWVKEHNKELIQKAHLEGIEPEQFVLDLLNYFKSDKILNYLGGEENKFNIVGKSMNSLDLPLLERYLGWDFMRKYFTRSTVDVSDISRYEVMKGNLPNGVTSSKRLMQHFEMGEDVEHTALADCIDMVNIYFRLLDL